MNQPLSLEHIRPGIATANIEDVPLKVLRGTHHCIYHFRRELVHEPLLERTTGRTLDTIDDILPLPSFSFE